MHILLNYPWVLEISRIRLLIELNIPSSSVTTVHKKFKLFAYLASEGFS